MHILDFPIRNQLKLVVPATDSRKPVDYDALLPFGADLARADMQYAGLHVERDDTGDGVSRRVTYLGGMF